MENEFLLSFKLSQDFLETFFSAVRSRGGFNNNPNANQFESAYKRLLIRNEIKMFDTSNCLADGLDILHCTSKKEYFRDVLTEDMDEVVDSFDHDYINTMWSLDPYIENVVGYISGFVVRKILKKNICEVCAKHLMSYKNESLLIRLKSRGGLIFPSKDVTYICQVGERIFRQHIHEIFIKKDILKYLINKIFVHTSSCFMKEDMNDHVIGQDFFDNHRIQLIKLVIEIYLKVRFHHEATLRSEKDVYIRQKYTKLILFSNQ